MEEVESTCPPSVMILTNPVEAEAGTMKDREFADRTWKLSRETPLILTSIAAPTFTPLTVTTDPVETSKGVSDVIVGGTLPIVLENAEEEVAFPKGDLISTRPLWVLLSIRATIVVELTIAKPTLTPPTNTWLTPARLVPEICIAVPAPPETGLKVLRLARVGAKEPVVTVKDPGAVTKVPEAEIATAPGVSPSGTTAIRVVADTKVVFARELPKLMVVEGVNPRPVIVTLVPVLPDVGVNEIICRLIERIPGLHPVKPAFVTETLPEIAFVGKVA